MQKNYKRYFQFLLVVLAAGAIFPLIYLKTNYQETILTVFNMTLPQLNTIYSVLGLVFVFGYIPSGILSDKFSAKWLLAFSLFLTALGGFWFAQVPDYNSVVIIFCIWGFSSVFTFWSSHMKVVKVLAKKEEEGRFFGILDGGRGVVEAVLASVAVVIFANMGGNNPATTRDALVGVIYMYSFALLAVSILIGIFVEDDKKVALENKKEVVEESKFHWADLSKVVKNKLVFLMGGIIFMGYAVTWTVYYYGGFLQSNIGIDATSVAKIMVIVLWMRPIGGIVGGFLADRFGKGNVLAGAMLLCALCLVGMSVLPYDFAQVAFFGLVIGAGVFLYGIRGTYWSILGDCKIDNKIVGTAIGLVSFIGYLPDIFLPMFNTYLWNSFGAQGGYNAYFLSSAVFGVIGAVLVFIFVKSAKKVA